MKEKINYSNKNIAKNAILSVVCKVMSIILSFMSAPLMLHCLEIEKYGVWASLLSIVSWVYYFDFGIGNGMRNKLAESLALGNYDLSKKYIKTAYVMLTIISGGIFLISSCLLVIMNVDEMLNVHLADESIKWILVVAIFWACVNFVSSLVNNILYAGQKSAMVSVFNVIGQAMFVGFLLLYVKYGAGLLIALTMAEGSLQFIKNGIASVYTVQKYNTIIPLHTKVEIKYARSILSFGLQVFILQMCALVLNTTDNIIILKYLGAEEVTPYSLCYKFFSMENSVFVALITPLLSAYTMAYVKKDYRWIKNVFRKSFLIYLLFAVGAMVGVVIFEPFMHIWLQKELYYNPGLVPMTCLYFIMLMFTHVFSTFLNGISKLKESTLVMLVQTSINIPISIFCAVNLHMGVNGVVLGSIVVMSIGVMSSLYLGGRELHKMEEIV